MLSLEFNRAVCAYVQHLEPEPEPTPTGAQQTRMEMDPRGFPLSWWQHIWDAGRPSAEAIAAALDELARQQAQQQEAQHGTEVLATASGQVDGRDGASGELRGAGPRL